MYLIKYKHIGIYRKQTGMVAHQKATIPRNHLTSELLPPKEGVSCFTETTCIKEDLNVEDISPQALISVVPTVLLCNTSHIIKIWDFLHFNN